LLRVLLSLNLVRPIDNSAQRLTNARPAPDDPLGDSIAGAVDAALRDTGCIANTAADGVVEVTQQAGASTFQAVGTVAGAGSQLIGSVGTQLGKIIA